MAANLSDSFMTETIMPLSEAVQGYEMFNEMKTHKVIFVADKQAMGGAKELHLSTTSLTR